MIWTSPEGTEFFVRYVADEFGYRVVESNALQRSAHGQLADGNQVLRTDDSKRSEVAMPREQIPEASVIPASTEKAYEPQILEQEAPTLSRVVTSRGRGLARASPQETKTELSTVPEAKSDDNEVSSSLKEISSPVVADVPIDAQEKSAAEVEEVAQALTEMLKINAIEITTPQDLISQAEEDSQANAIELPSDDGGFLKPVEESSDPVSTVDIASADDTPAATIPEEEPELQKSASAADEAGESILPLGTEPTPSQTDEPALDATRDEIQL
ncbi:hypothetical protein HAZT_HAZT006000 [Hyalella azteca]|uniref:Uncharacterized protein n=1 Tax=Hyalella azteca TaxID=294128 RepID=A0A6A0H6F2_HYAAZ|nr:hypothetical protein HAZT_HAZT006000 [Hyalella azteca]